MPHFVAPSLLSANFLNLEQDVLMLNRSEADWIHVDVMDGVFVPNITFGFNIISRIKSVATKPLDVHLMIVEPERYLDRFRKAGADIISIHAEACKDVVSALKTIRSLGAKAGIVINPETPVNVLSGKLDEADMVLVMSVHPGFGGQSFIPHSLEKISELRKMIQSVNPGILIEVDGGVDLQNAATLVTTGVDVLVAGNTIFASADPTETIRQLRHIC